jgi:hypothetical protein
VLLDAEDWKQDILEEHWAELEFLWNQRLRAFDALDFDSVGLLRLDRRIDAHTDALALAGDRAGAMLSEGLLGDGVHALAAGLIQLRRREEEAAREVAVALTRLTDEGLEGLTRALCLAPFEEVASVLSRMAWPSDPRAAAAIACALAAHGQKVDGRRLHALGRSSEPMVRKLSFRAAGAMGGAAREIPGIGLLLQAGAADGAEDVRREALTAAAWARQDWLLEYCRSKAKQSLGRDAMASRMLAILGSPEDLPLISNLGREPSLGPARFDLLASYGHPDCVELLIVAMERESPSSAAAAAAAFARMTGEAVETGRRVPATAKTGDSPSEEEQQEGDEVFVPDTARARSLWNSRRENFRKASSRWIRGENAASLLPQHLSPRVDLRSRWELSLRRHFEGAWEGNAAEIERFPHRFT